MSGLATSLLVLVASATQVTHANLSDPSFSPDERRMVLIAMHEGHEQLAVAGADGDHLQLITHGPFDREDPAWSPDGRWIAYVSKDAGGEVIHVMRPDGRGDRALSPSSQRAIHPNWSRDSRSILYCTDDDLAPPRKNDSDILSVRLADRRVSTIVTGGTNTYPALSPDGRWLAFRKMVGGTNSEVWLARGDGSQPRNLTNSPAFDGWPAWSPDGRRIAYASNPAGNHKIYVMDADGGSPTLVADTPGRGTAPKWSPDGRTIYFTICQRMAGTATCEIYRAPAPGGSWGGPPK